MFILQCNNLFLNVVLNSIPKVPLSNKNSTSKEKGCNGQSGFKNSVHAYGGFDRLMCGYIEI